MHMHADLAGNGACAPLESGPDGSTRAFLLGGLSVLSGLALPFQAVAQSTRPQGEAIAVFFPDIGEPFRKIFIEIIAGIEEQSRQKVRPYPIGQHHDLGELFASLKRQNPRVLVALGRQGLKAAAALEAPLGLVVGGVSSVPDGDKFVGICLTPDPALLFAQLKSLVPAARRVTVIYNPAHNDWLVRLAREAARTQGLELAALEARDLAGAARLYQSMFASIDGRTESVWLPTDPTTVDESTILPLVLREAWNRTVPIFSSSVLHVRKGALFALYPHNHELGRSLANLAIGLLAGETVVRGVSPLRDVHAALNVRTAGHFGIPITPRMQRAFQILHNES